MSSGECDVCSVCSAQSLGPGAMRIRDKRKWILAPNPCPQCKAQSDRMLSDIAQSVAMEREQKVLDVLTGDNIENIRE